MRWTGVASLDQIVTGTLRLGTVLAGVIFRFVGWWQNAGIVTLTTPAWTTITAHNCGTVESGDFGVVLFTMIAQKGIGAGQVSLRITPTGTATINTYPGGLGTNNFQRPYAAGVTDSMCVAFAFEVTGSGTLTLSVQGLSVGSNASIADADGRSFAAVFNGA